MPILSDPFMVRSAGGTSGVGGVQVSIGHSSSSYFDVAVASATGGVTFNAVGSSPSFTFADPVGLPDSAVTAPTLRGSSRLTTGLWWNNAGGKDLVGITAGGVEVVRYNDTGAIYNSKAVSGITSLAAVSLTLGTTSATGGVLNLPNNQTISARATLTSTSYRFARLNTSDQWNIDLDGRGAIFSGTVTSTGSVLSRTDGAANAPAFRREGQGSGMYFSGASTLISSGSLLAATFTGADTTLAGALTLNLGILSVRSAGTVSTPGSSSGQLHYNTSSGQFTITAYGAAANSNLVLRTTSGGIPWNVAAFGVDRSVTFYGDVSVAKTGSGQTAIALASNSVAGSYPSLLMYTGGTKYNWRVSAQNTADQSFEITPSTVAGGTTFTTPALTIHGETYTTSLGGDYLYIGGNTGQGIFRAGSGSTGVVGNLKLQDGSSATPSLAFFNAGALGLYRVGSTMAAWNNDFRVDGDLTVSGAGPHAIGGAGIDYIQMRLVGSFASGGLSSRAAVFSIGSDLTAAVGDVTGLALMEMGSSYGASITTGGGAETYAVAASAIFSEPGITVGAGDSVTTAATVYIADAPTEGATNWALRVNSGSTYFGGGLVVGGESLAIGAGAIRNVSNLIVHHAGSSGWAIKNAGNSETWFSFDGLGNLTATRIIKTSSNIQATGPLTAAAANTTMLAKEAGYSALWALGADNATYGELRLYAAVANAGTPKGIAITSDGAVIDGNITAADLPTTDPGVPGRLWNDAGTVKVS